MSERGGPAPKIIVFVLITLFAATNLHAGNVKYKRTVETYTVPGVTLVNQDGKRVDFRSLLLESEKPVLLDFIYATCTTICPILSVGFSNLQKRLGQDSGSVQLVSISIDPDNDTPEIMKDYLRRYRAKPGWDFLTGNRTDIIAVMRAFDAYVANKMNHYPLTILHAQGDDKWVRIYGLLGTADLMEEYKKLSSK
ncbi:MAG: SCO family protein [Deltaproteobacteria bacterium]|nr:SCO family protein [Deltaproteobacteria bacterium]NNG46798.1 SCO family protein [Deltaproteobacteria bacterium]